jgi:DNA end-binding protein Ku
MRNKEYVGALRARNGHLMLMTLRHANEVIAASSLPRPAGKEPTAKEVRLAEQLVEALEGQFDVEAFEDEYRLRVMDLVAHKAKGETMKLGKPHAKPGSPDTSLVEVLQASLEQRKGKRVA